MLKIDHIYKKFKNDNVMILDNINLTVNEGEIVGLLGKNGAGKTTLMKIIAKTKKPTSGHIYIDKIDIFKHDNILKNVGIMIDTVYYEHLTAERNLLYFLKVNNQTQYIDNIHNILKLVGLLDTKNKKVKDFSFGMKQRLSLAMCLLTEPKLAIMDEPFVGLDPNGVKILISSLKNWVKNKRISLLISSHQLNELEEVCDRFVMLKEGKLHSIELDKHVSFNIVLKKNVTQADTLSYIEFFPIINKIEDNIIYINKEGDDYNGLMQKILEKYNLVSIENTEEDLYHIFNHFENKGDD